MNHILRIALTFIFSLVLLSESRADLFQLNITTTGTVNGQPVFASATGVGDSSTGTAITDWTFTSVPDDFHVFGSVVFSASSVMHTFALETGGASNLFTLSGGNYSVSSVSVFPGGEQLFADITVSTTLSTSGFITTAMVELSGDVTLPPLVDATGAFALWTPGPEDNQFIETFTKFLIPADGPPIPVDNVRIYTLADGFLPQPQLRILDVTVLRADPSILDPATATIQYVDIVAPVTPIPEPSTFALFALGTLALLGWRWRGRKMAA